MRFPTFPTSGIDREGLPSETIGDDPTPRSITHLLIIACFVSEALVFRILGIPGQLSFSAYGFEDPGADLTSYHLIRHGWVPYDEFGYIYGLIPLIIGDAWYRVFGLGPWASAALDWAGMISVAAILTISACSVKRKAWAMHLFLALAIPILMQRRSANSAKVFEALLMSLSFYYLIKERRGSALTAMTACVFAKSGVPASLVAVLGMLILAREWKKPLALVRTIGPAVGLSIALFAICLVRFGLSATVNSIIPADGAKIYAANHFGFFHGIGRNFWNPPGVRLGYYIGTVAGFWLAGTVVLLGGGLAALRRLALGRSAHRGTDECIVLCALGHAVFVTFAFGNAWSWAHYLPVLFFGLTAVARAERWTWIIAPVLALIALPGDCLHIKREIEAWKRTSAGPTTYHLFADRVEAGDWNEILNRTKGKRTVLLATSDGVTLFEPRLEPPAAFYLDPSELKPREIREKLKQLRTAEAVVVRFAAENTFLAAPDKLKAFESALAEFDLVLERSAFRLYERRTAGQSEAE